MVAERVLSPEFQEYFEREQEAWRARAEEMGEEEYEVSLVLCLFVCFPDSLLDLFMFFSVSFHFFAFFLFLFCLTLSYR